MLTLLLEATVKGSIILALAAALTGLMRGRSAAARHLVWGIALLLAAAMPLATRLLPAWRVSLPMEVASRLSPTRTPTLGQSEASIPASGLPSVTVAPSSSSGKAQDTGTAAQLPLGHATEAAPISLAAALTICWLLVAAMFLARLLADIARLARLTRRARPVNDTAWRTLLDAAARSAGVTRPVRLLVSEKTTVPMTWGFARPVLLLPPDYQEWGVERRRAVLIHELAHVARGDSVTHLAAQLCCALYWFNPLIWLAARALMSERERACDDRVLAAGTRASAYAGELLDIARTSLGREPHAVALAMARRSELEGRLLSILNPKIRRDGPGARSAVLLGGAALALALPLAAFRPAQSAAPAVPSQPSSTLSPPAPQEQTSTPQRGDSTASRGAAREANLAMSLTTGIPVSDPVVQNVAANALPCDRRSVDSRHSHSSMNWTETNGGSKSWKVSWSGVGCEVNLVARGDVKFNADFSDVTEISPGGYLEITVREGETTRRIEFRPQGGTLRRTYFINGNAAPYDDAARAWLSAFLIELDRHTGFAVEARFPALLKQGVSAVLDEIDQMSSDYVRGLYYLKLFTSAKLSPSEVRRAATAAGSTMDSDYELGRVLAALAAHYSLEDGAVRAAFIDAAGTLESDYERAQLLLVVIGKGAVTGESGHAIVKLAGGMSSDYEKSRVLMALGARLQGPLIVVDGKVQDTRNSQSLASDYLDVVVGMQSDYERGRVLQLVLGSGRLSNESMIRVLEVTRSMSSDYEAANVLIALASHNQVDDVVKDAYLKAADRLKSDYESQRARAALRRQ